MLLMLMLIEERNVNVTTALMEWMSSTSGRYRLAVLALARAHMRALSNLGTNPAFLSLSPFPDTEN